MSEEVTKKILKEMEQMSKGGEGSGVKGHRMETGEEKSKRQEKERRKYIEAEKWNGDYKRM